MHRYTTIVVAAGLFTLLLASTPCRAQDDAPLPPGVKAVWDLTKAQRQATPTRERICINGLWRWQPAGADSGGVPAGNWGYFKVPGPWPGIFDYMQAESQTVFSHPSWRATTLYQVRAAWYQRSITTPPEWAGRRIALTTEYLNSFAQVYVDGREAGVMRFPAGEVDLTPLLHPGTTQTLSLRVVAMALRAVQASFSDPAAAEKMPGDVYRRGLCGDVFLLATPPAAHLGQFRVATSVRRGQITFNAELLGLAATGPCRLRASIHDIHDGSRPVADLTSPPFQGGDLKAGWFAFTASWKPDKLWDTTTPENQYQATLSLLDADGKMLDTQLPQRFGFRELWIDGRDFYLNGTRIFLCAVPFQSPMISAGAANYDAAKEALLRFKSFGVNMVYSGNYGCEPGTNLSYAEVLRAADDVGMLVSLSQAHFAQYDWQAADADRTNGYARDAANYVGVAGSHPSVVFYAMSHNAASYVGSANPDVIDGLQGHWTDPQWARTPPPPLRAQAIVQAMDPSRVVYHHAAGNLGAVYTENFYTNFTPMQELDDWFEHWATQGVKPMFTCEFGSPIGWDYTMYRGWYEGRRDWGGAQVPWELCSTEWSAQFFGDAGFNMTDLQKQALRWEAGCFRAGVTWHHWDYPAQLGNIIYPSPLSAPALYITSNWRAMRTWGLSGLNRWDFEPAWTLRDGVDKSRKPLTVDWDHLQRPGFSPDFVEPRFTSMPYDFQRSDWIPTPIAQALYRNNMPLLAYIAGKPAAFTSKDHNLLPGQTVDKQLIIINNSRRTVTADCGWALTLPRPIKGGKRTTIATGDQARIPIRLSLPAALPPGDYALTATVRFNDGQTQTDTFAINVLPTPAPLHAASRIALFDPKGETAKLLDAIGVHAQPIQPDADLAGYDILVIGKAALSPDGPAPNLARVCDGLKVVVFEQTAAALEKRLGLRTEEYGLRNVFRRIPDHPVLANLTDASLHDWAGQATITPPRLTYVLSPTYQSVTPTVTWCGIEVPHIWRCGNRGNVASVLIEKPGRGDFLPIIDGGFSLQYSPLMEYREGKGMVLFCQLDVTGRTEPDPAADALARNILRYAAAWQPPAHRQALYTGDPAGATYLQSVGIAVQPYGGGNLAPEQVLIAGPSAGPALAPSAAAIAQFLKGGGHLLAIGLDQANANAFLPFQVKMVVAEHIGACLPAAGVSSPLAGISSAEVQNHDPRSLPLISGDADPVGDGVLATATGSNLTFCQLVPYAFAAPHGQPNLRRTFRRTSFLVARLLANAGIAAPTPLLTRFGTPVAPESHEQRWLDGLYVDHPLAWDDPYRFFGW